ncbi:MAG: hypothetical protein DWP97_01065 [Calditrichaeota bacterium]|nr:MAG: hypothetical protein DWP97_01065 [Calditrichota bacterium]
MGFILGELMMQDILTNLNKAFIEYAPSIGGALVILLLGWIVALIFSKVTSYILKRTNLHTKLTGLLGSATNDTPPNIPSGAGIFVFWIIMTFAFISAFQVLNLTIITEPISGFMNELLGFFPQLIGAGVLLLLAWIIAKIVKLVVTKVLQKTGIDEKIGGNIDSEKSATIPLSNTVGDILHWLVYLLFLPAILDTLALQGLLEPVQSMLNQFLGYFPNIFGALIIGVVGWFIANIVRKIVTGLLAATKVDNLSEKYNLAPISKIVGMIVYILIFLPALISALNTLKLEAITTPASSMLTSLFSALPNLFAAGLILAIGFFIGKFVSGIMSQLLSGIGFDNLLSKSGINNLSQKSEKSLSSIAGHIIFVIVMLFSLLEASSMLGFETLSTLISELTVFGGHILFGTIILFIGLYLSNLAATAIKNSKGQNSAFLAQIAKVVIMLLIGSMAIRQMGIANEIINMAFGLALGAVAIAVAIAFGFGGREVAAKKLTEWNDNFHSKTTN